MFSLGDAIKEVFLYNFYTFDNLNKYDKKYYDIDSEEFKEIRDDLIKGFGTGYKENIR